MENLAKRDKDQGSSLAGSGGSGQSGFKEENISLVVEKVENHKTQGIIGGSFTHFAVKNATSYMIGTSRHGFKVIENGSVIHLGRLPGRDQQLADIVYADHLDCYFLYHNYKIYRKDVDDKPPYVFMDLRCRFLHGCCFRYTKVNKRLLIISEDCESILVINVDRKQVEMKITRNALKDELVQDFRIFGKKETELACLTKEGTLVVFSLDYLTRKVLRTSQSKISLLSERREETLSMAVCGNNEYILVEIEVKQFFGRHHSSRMAVFHHNINSRKLVLKATLDLYEEYRNNILGRKCALTCGGYITEDHILWIGVGLP